MSHLTCRLCASCHCHDCVMQEREVKRQAIQSLIDERDEWRKKAELLQGELAYARAVAAREVNQHLNAVLGPGYETLPELKADRDRLRAALEKYGRHHGHCGAAAYPRPSGCTCGLTALLEVKETPGDAERQDG
jgi:hypothetical protein